MGKMRQHNTRMHWKIQIITIDILGNKRRSVNDLFKRARKDNVTITYGTGNENMTALARINTAHGGLACFGALSAVTPVVFLPYSSDQQSPLYLSGGRGDDLEDDYQNQNNSVHLRQEMQQTCFAGYLSLCVASVHTLSL